MNQAKVKKCVHDGYKWPATLASYGITTLEEQVYIAIFVESPFEKEDQSEKML